MDTCGSAGGQRDLPLVGVGRPTLNFRSNGELAGKGQSDPLMWMRSHWFIVMMLFFKRDESFVPEIQTLCARNPKAGLASDRDAKLKDKPVSPRHMFWALECPLKWGRGQTFSVNTPESKYLRLTTTLCLSQ